MISLLLGASLAAAPPALGPAEAQGNPGRNLREIRVRNLRGVLRLRLLGLLRLTDEQGAYLLGRYEARNARSASAEIRPENLLLRTPDGKWLEAFGVADRPPLSGHPLRPSLATRSPVVIPRDRTFTVYAVFRTASEPGEVDVAASFDRKPVFLRRPLRVSTEQLARDALRLLEKGERARARGLLVEAARHGEKARLRIGETLVVAARKLRAADQPIAEDRVLRLALPYAPNPGFVQARLRELRRLLRRRHPQTNYRPAQRDWAYHDRRSERYVVIEEEPRPKTSWGRPR